MVEKEVLKTCLSESALQASVLSIAMEYLKSRGNF